MLYMLRMRISYLTKTKTLGPGTRCAIWMQGCKKRCYGCINPEGQNLNGGYEISIDELIKKILQYDGICGITISGGEPFLQYDELLSLIERIKLIGNLDIMLFSGYTLQQIQVMYPQCMDLLNNVDIFVDGEYRSELNDNSQYRGSSNQNIYCFTDKYRKHIQQIEKSKKRAFSFEIVDNGEVFFVGIPPKGLYEKFLEEIGRQST